MRTSNDFERWTWPVEQLGEACEALAAAAQLGRPGTWGAAEHGDAGTLGEDIERHARQLGCEAEAVTTTYAEAERFVMAAAPALLIVSRDSCRRLLAVVRGGRRVTVIGSDRARGRIPAALIAGWLRLPLEHSVQTDIERLLDEAAIPAARHARVRPALLRVRLGQASLPAGWLLRPHPGSGIAEQLRMAGLRRYPVVFSVAHTLAYLLWLLAWALLGRTAFSQRIEWSLLAACALLLVTMLALRLVALWAQGRFALGAGLLLRRRLMRGALLLEPDRIRRQGVGQLLGRVIETDTLEQLALGGGFFSLLAVIELLLGAVVLAAGAGGVAHAIVLGCWIGATLLLLRRFALQRRHWASARVALTHDLIEHMVGYRTRLAQQAAGHWHQEEDAALEHYTRISVPMDRTTAVLLTAVPRGWLILSLTVLVPSMLAGVASVALAASLGGTLLVYQALQRLVLGAGTLVNAGIAWRQVEPLYHAAAHEPAPADARQRPAPSDTTALLEARHVTFRYPGRDTAVLRVQSLRIDAGDRVLLEGASGSGKSTLAALLCGLRVPERGTLLLGGYDQATLGAAEWRRAIVLVPQLHENYVLTGSLAFNLLLGRRWPPQPEDLADAELVCRELGLGELLERMPAGLMQPVGESGWQLSHGERARLAIARALLQNAAMVTLDESLVALDPQTLHLALDCALTRARTLLLIAHR